MRKTADRLERRIKRGHYDAVIGVETSCSYVLARELGCLRIFSCESLLADEYFFSKNNYELERIRRLREMELELFENVDFVVFPWQTTENYVRKYIWNGDNFVTIKYGCYPQKEVASYFFPSSIISLGSSDAYWSNPELISFLTRISPYSIEVYGKNKPDKKYRLNYKGYASSPDILRNYQFGLSTVSRDTLRRNHFFM